MDWARGGSASGTGRYKGSVTRPAAEGRRRDAAHADWRWLGRRHLQDHGDGGRRRCHGFDPGLRRHMKDIELRYVTQERAALLLGISEQELSRISEESGLGHKERAEGQEETF